MTNLDYSITPLCKLFAEYGADKCPQILHSYSPIYFDILNPIKEKVNTLLEIGIGNKPLMSPIVGDHYVPGASLRAWARYFDKAHIFGCDIDRSVLFNENNIRCFFMDQSNKNSIDNCVKQIKKSIFKEHLLFDVIIDDGSHIKDHMIMTFNILKNHLSSNGIYIIEDIKLKNLQEFINLSYNLSDIKIEYVHKGYNDWDSFVAYKKQ